MEDAPVDGDGSKPTSDDANGPANSGSRAPSDEGKGPSPMPRFGSGPSKEEPVAAIPMTSSQRIVSWWAYWPTMTFALLLLAGVAGRKIEGALGGISTLSITIVGYVCLSILWKFLQRGVYRSGFVAGMLSWFYGPVYGVVFLVFVAAGTVATCGGNSNSGDEDLSEYVYPGRESSTEETESPILRALLEESSSPTTKLLPRQFAPIENFPYGGIEGRDRFDECIEDLYGRHDARNEIDTAIRRTKDISYRTAEDLVHIALLKTCIKHAKAPVNHLGSYFQGVLKNTRGRAWKESKKFDTCSIQDNDASYTPDPDRIIDDVKAFCRLDAGDQHLLMLRAEGFTHEEIAARLGISESNSRTRTKRAREQL